MAITLQNEGDYALFVASSPLSDVATVVGVNDATSGSGTLKKEFAWSFDNKTFSQYFDSSDVDNLLAVNVPATELWFKFRYTLESSGPVTIDSVTMDVTHQNVPKKSTPNPVYNPYRIGNVKGTMFLNSDGYNPYAVDELKQMAQGLSNMVNRQWGIEANYYRAKVDDFGTDVILREYTLQNVEPAKCCKVVVPNNQFPDANYSFSPFGIDYSDIPFEVHIDKKYFQSIFGEGAHPQKRDIIYIPIMDKIFEVMDSFLHRNIMQIQLFYKVKLYKWSPKPTNVIVPSSVADADNPLLKLEAIAKNTQTEFGDEQKREEKKYTNKQQLKKKTPRVDVLRTSINHRLLIQEKDLVNYYNTLTHFRYDLSSILPSSGSPYDIAVTYEQNCSWPVGSNRTFAAWFKENSPLVQVKTYEKNFVSLVKNSSTGKIELTLNQPIKDVSSGDEITIYSEKNWFLLPCNVDSVTKVSSQWTYVCTPASSYILRYDSSTSTWAGRIEEAYPGWAGSFSTIRPRFKKSYKCNFITGDSDFEISAHGMRYFRVKLNDLDEWFDVMEQHDTPLDPTSFHAIVASISSEFNQLELNLYVQDLSATTTELTEVYSSVKNIDGINITLSSDEDFVLRAAPIVMTNIRLMDTIVPKEQQSFFLNQTIVLDADLGLILDNAIPQSLTPYIGRII